MSKITLRARLITALLFAILGILALVGSNQLNFGTLNKIGPGFFPTIFGWLTIILSIALALFSYRSFKLGKETEKEDEEEPIHLKGAFTFIGIFIVFVICTYAFGFIIASFLSVGLAGYVLNLRKLPLLALAVFTTLAIWLLFDLWLGITLPTSIWF